MTPLSPVHEAEMALLRAQRDHRNHPSEATFEAVQVAEDAVQDALAARRDVHVPKQRGSES